MSNANYQTLNLSHSLTKFLPLLLYLSLNAYVMHPGNVSASQSGPNCDGQSADQKTADAEPGESGEEFKDGVMKFGCFAREHSAVNKTRRICDLSAEDA